jgi:hypothetical protein
MVRWQTPFHEQFLDVAIRKRKPQIPTDGANNNLGFEVSPFKQGWPRFGHPSAAYQNRASTFLQHIRLLQYESGSLSRLSAGTRMSRPVIARPFSPMPLPRQAENIMKFDYGQINCSSQGITILVMGLANQPTLTR